ncbi:hypothetical protein niasHT_036350 [Heterodera trifolii]|uniref:Uncharacterized protein n=1 Tax=Heterodera trifolii TaxID=157864 RepID=A0ABD2IVD0_9BILA
MSFHQKNHHSGKNGAVTEESRSSKKVGREEEEMEENGGQRRKIGGWGGGRKVRLVGRQRVRDAMGAKFGGLSAATHRSTTTSTKAGLADNGEKREAGAGMKRKKEEGKEEENGPEEMREREESMWGEEKG